MFGAVEGNFGLLYRLHYTGKQKLGNSRGETVGGDVVVLVLLIPLFQCKHFYQQIILLRLPWRQRQQFLRIVLTICKSLWRHKPEDPNIHFHYLRTSNQTPVLLKRFVIVQAISERANKKKRWHSLVDSNAGNCTDRRRE